MAESFHSNLLQSGWKRKLGQLQKQLLSLEHESRWETCHTRTLNDIIIKPADKGGAIVVQNMADYKKKKRKKKEAYRQLNDEQFYRKWKANPTLDFQKKIFNATDMALKLNWISEDEHYFLPVTPVFVCYQKFTKALSNLKADQL